MFTISTHILSCGLQTHDPNVAMLFVRMIAKIISPENFIAAISELGNPDWTKAAIEVAKACVGVTL